MKRVFTIPFPIEDEDCATPICVITWKHSFSEGLMSQLEITSIEFINCIDAGASIMITHEQYAKLYFEIEKLKLNYKPVLNDTLN